MSLLPQRKKSAEEIASLRESLGIGGTPGPPATGTPPADESVPSPAPVSLPAPTALPAPVVLPTPDTPQDPTGPRPLAGRVPVLPSHEAASSPKEPERKPEPVTPPVPKMVRSLKKSEQGPIPEIQPPEPDSKLPIHRHDERELHEIRRQAAISKLSAPVHPPVLTAHWIAITPGYLFALGAALGMYFYDLEMEVTGACVALALLVATILYLKRPLSRHHAAFIGAIALFVIVFGALHYFPQLQHGT